MIPTRKFWRWLKWLTAGLLALALVLPTLAQGTTTVKVTPAELRLPVGGVVELLVNVENVTNLFGAELAISFDPNVLEVIDANPDKAGVQIAPGDLLSPDFEGINQVNNGLIDYALTQVMPNPPVSGSGTLVRITFRGKADGTSPVALQSILLSDHNGAGIANTRQSGTIMVGTGGAPSTAVPPTATSVPATPVPTLPPVTPAPTTPVPTPVPTTPAPTPIPPAPGPTPVAPTPVPLPPTPAPAAPPAITAHFDCTRLLGYHVVQRGESLYAIARAYQVNPYAIAACNRLITPRFIHASNRLAIPNVPWVPTPPGPTAVRQWDMGASSLGCRLDYTVHTGDTLTLLAGRYGINMWSIVQVNNIHNPNLIYVGQRLCIP